MLGPERREVVVPRAVQPQYQRRPVMCIGHLEGDVLAQMHEAQVPRCDTECHQRLPRGRYVGLLRRYRHVWLRAASPAFDRHGRARPAHHASSSAIVSSHATRNSAAFSCEKTSGGRIFTTLPKMPALLVRKPLSFSRLITRLASSVSGDPSAGFTSSTPMNRPWPRTSPIASLAPLRWVSDAFSAVPTEA